MRTAEEGWGGLGFRYWGFGVGVRGVGFGGWGVRFRVEGAMMWMRETMSISSHPPRTIASAGESCGGV